VTLSAGVACLSPDDIEGADLVRRADEALYRAKEAGRNRVEAA
jgi:two-component system cell cycle response regulator